jgi:hypothetical protein
MTGNGDNNPDSHWAQDPQASLKRQNERLQLLLNLTSRITSRKLAEIARSTSRRSRFDVMRLVRFRSNCRRSFCRCKLACGFCAHWGSGLLSPFPLMSFAKKCPVIQQSVSQKRGWNHLASDRRFWQRARVKATPGQHCLACSPRKTKQLQFAFAICLPS